MVIKKKKIIKIEIREEFFFSYISKGKKWLFVWQFDLLKNTKVGKKIIV